MAARQTNSAPVQKITIVPRTSGALGYTMQVEEGNHYLMTKEELEALIAEGLKAALTTGDPAGPEAQHVCQLHEQWIRMHWADNDYSRGAHLSLAYGYLADQRFMDYYETRAGQGATQFLVDALTVYCS